MNVYMRNLKKALLFGIVGANGKGGGPYTWYLNEDEETITTEFYYGVLPTTTVPKKMDYKPVTRVGCTTFASNENVTTVSVQDSVTVIE